MRLLNFLERPSGGILAFDGQPVTERLSLAQRRRVTAVFQRPALLRRSVAANIAYGRQLRGQKPVSYTHLDVYKRQVLGSIAEIGMATE